VVAVDEKKYIFSRVGFCVFSDCDGVFLLVETSGGESTLCHLKFLLEFDYGIASIAYLSTDTKQTGLSTG
jgi:hypothetical protein